MNVNIAIASTVPQTLPSGTIPKYRFWYQGGPTNQSSPYQDEPITQPFSEFLGVPPGNYVGACVVIDQTGANMTAIATAPFVVPDPGVSVDAPTSLTVTLVP